MRLPARILYASLAAGLALADPASADVFMNELHYDDSTASGDSGERIEVVATAGESLEGYRVVLYNGNGGAQYDDDLVPTGTLQACDGTVRVALVAYPTNGIQNGAPDGVALVDPTGAVVQFLSYEGSFAASNGPAAGMTSVDIGVAESNSTAPGTSLQLSGSGSAYAQFTWQASSAESFGACNTGQSFDAGVDVPPTVVSTVPAGAATNVAVGANLHVSFSEAVAATSGAFSLNCASTGARLLAVSGGPVNFVLDPQTDLGFSESCALTIVGAEIIDQDGTPDAMVGTLVVDFETEADLPPQVIATQPADGALGVPAVSNVGVTFSEPVEAIGDWAMLACSASGNVALSISGGPTQWTLDPALELQPVETCTLSVLAASILDLDGEPDALQSNVVVYFTVSAGVGSYYDSVDASSCVALRSTLHDVIDDHTFFPYTASVTDTWDILEQADQDPMDPTRIVDVYRNASYAKAGGGNTNYNREHTWPNSYGYNDRINDHAYTDAQMLYLANSTYNSTRSNIPYADCSSLIGCAVVPTDTTNGRGGGPQVYPGEHNWFSNSLDSFEVWAGRKGDVARAVLYMDIRYEGGTHGITGQPEPDLILTDERALIQTTPGGVFSSVGYMGLKSTLLAWHAADPPDSAEQLRNELVYSYQGNRNPFIDHPEWVACLHTCDCPTAPPNEIFANGFEP